MSRRKTDASPPKPIEAGEDLITAGLSTETRPVVRRTFKIGMMAQELGGTAPDFLVPLPDEDLFLWEGDE